MDGSKAAAAPGEPPERAGLRERKAASTRLAIAHALGRRLETTALADIRVEDLAVDANVSRMTFFNYFPTKEHALELVAAVWMFELQADIARQGLTGVAAIERLFARYGDYVADNPERMRRFVVSLFARPPERDLAVLGRLERAELAPDLADRDIEPLALGALLLRSIGEARRAGEIALEGTTYELAHYLGALVTGAGTVGHSSSSETDWRRLFRRHVRRALGLPLTGKGAGAPPTTPERWKKKPKGAGPRAKAGTPAKQPSARTRKRRPKSNEEGER